MSPRMVPLALVLALALTARAACAADVALSRATLENDSALLHAYDTTVELHDVRVARCDAATDAREGELARTIVDVSARAPYPDVDKRLRFVGKPRFSIEKVVVRLPRSITWPGMTQAERDAAADTIAALRHHEAGHVRTAAAEVARLNDLPPVATNDPFDYRRLVTQRSADGLAAIARSQTAYDALTDHGRSQERAGGILRGPATVLLCTVRAEGQRRR